MYGLYWIKRFEGNVYDKAIVTLAQKCLGFGNYVKVNVKPGFMSVTGVSRYNESATKFLESNGFTSMEEYDYD